MKKKDHYVYWSKLGTHKKLHHREEICLKILRKFNSKKLKFLDIGCGDGLFLEHLRKQNQFELLGGDYSDSQIEKCKSKELNVIKINLEEKLPFKDNYFDIVYAGEVIEHLYNPDYALKEIRRILKPNGYFLLSTPNLFAWYNRLLFPLGIKPLFVEMSTKSTLIGAGILKKFIKDSHPVGHIRIFNYNGLKDLLETHEFKILKLKGAAFIPLPIVYKIDKIISIFPTLSSILIIMAKKEK